MKNLFCITSCRKWGWMWPLERIARMEAVRRGARVVNQEIWLTYHVEVDKRLLAEIVELDPTQPLIVDLGPTQSLIVETETSLTLAKIVDLETALSQIVEAEAGRPSD